MARLRRAFYEWLGRGAPEQSQLTADVRAFWALHRRVLLLCEALRAHTLAHLSDEPRS